MILKDKIRKIIASFLTNKVIDKILKNLDKDNEASIISMIETLKNYISKNIYSQSQIHTILRRLEELGYMNIENRDDLKKLWKDFAQEIGSDDVANKIIMDKRSNSPSFLF